MVFVVVSACVFPRLLIGRRLRVSARSSFPKAKFWRFRKRRKLQLVKVSGPVSPSEVLHSESAEPLLHYAPRTLWRVRSAAESGSRRPDLGLQHRRVPALYFGTKVLRAPQADRRGRKSCRKGPGGQAFRAPQLSLQTPWSATSEFERFWSGPLQSAS